MNSPPLVVSALALLILPAVGLAGDEAPKPPQKVTVEAKGKLKFDGQIRIRPEYNNNNDFNSNRADSRDFTLLRTNLGLTWEHDDRYSARIDIRDARTMGSERNATGGIPGNTNTGQGNTDLYQGYVDYRPRGTSDWTLRMGRQGVIYGDERLVGTLDWLNAGRAFDGVLARHKNKDGRELDFFHFQLADLTLGPTGVTGRDDQTLSGAHATWLKDGHTLQTYLFHFKDDAAGNARSQLGVLGAQSHDTLGFRAKGPLSKKGKTDYTVEYARQFGDYSTDDLDAWATALILGKELPTTKRSRIEFEFDLSPGDDGTAGKRKSFQNLFPTNHKHYGIADRVSWVNMRAFRLSYMLWPKKGHNLRFDFWKLSLDDTRDNWYNVGGGGILRAASPNARRDLGTEFDVRYTFKDGSLKHQVGLSRFFGGDFQKDTGGGISDDATFAYYMLVFPF